MVRARMTQVGAAAEAKSAGISAWIALAGIRNSRAEKTICCPESDGASESHLGEENSPDYLSKISIQAVMEVV